MSSGPPVGLDATVGMRVVRGPDWKWGAQDGGVGTVGMVSSPEEGGTAEVSWPSGRTSKYRFGAEGKFDLCRADPAPLANPPALALGTHVVRGPNWRYSDQARRSSPPAHPS